MVLGLSKVQDEIDEAAHVGLFALDGVGIEPTPG